MERTKTTIMTISAILTTAGPSGSTLSAQLAERDQKISELEQQLAEVPEARESKWWIATIRGPGSVAPTTIIRL